MKLNVIAQLFSASHQLATTKQEQKLYFPNPETISSLHLE